MFVCKSIRLANFLLEHNCTIMKIDRDQLNRSFIIFIFKKDDNFMQTMSLWSDVTKGNYEDGTVKKS